MMKHLLILIVVFVPFHSAIAEMPVETAQESPLGSAPERPATPITDSQSAEPIFMMGSCTATADCGVHGPLTCNGNSTCSFVDRSCFTSSPTGGSVTCDGVTTPCPSNGACEANCWDEYWECLMEPESSLIECREDRASCICYC